MPRLIYSLFFTLLLPVLLLRLLQRSLKTPAYRRRLGERLGFFPAPSGERPLWLHAVSVGETIAAAPLVRALLLRHPQVPLVLTTMTPTGSAQVRQLFGDRVFHIYAPYDTPGAVRRFLRRARPRLAVVMETELWPNTVHYCQRIHCPVLVINARMSGKSARGYRRLAALTRSMLSKIDHIAAQTTSDGERFVALGLNPAQLTITGSIKYDVQISAQLRHDAADLRARYSNNGNRPVVIAASTHHGEDALILDAFAQIRGAHPDCLLILVPRHPERFHDVHELCRQRFRVSRRSGDTWQENTDILLGDTMGELMLLYGCADVALVGGSLVAKGGHNMLEPAAWGLPLITGTSAFNFAAISALLQSAGALQQVDGANSLASAVISLLNDEAQRLRAGNAASRTVAENQGALEKVLAIIDRYLEATKTGSEIHDKARQ